MARFWGFLPPLPPPVEAEEIEVFQAGVEYPEMTVNMGMAEGMVQGEVASFPPPDTACPLAALHLEEGLPAWVPAVTIDSAVFCRKSLPGCTTLNVY